MTKIRIPDWLVGRLFDLKTEASKAELVLSGASSRLGELQATRQRLEAHIQNIGVPHHRATGDAVNALNKRRDKFQEELDAVVKEIETQTEFRARARDHRQSIVKVHQDCDNWVTVEQRSRAVFEKVDTKARPATLENLDKVRQWIAACDDEIEDVRTAPPARADIQQAARQFFNELFTHGEPMIGFDNGKLSLKFSQRFKPTSVLAMLTWLHPDLVEQKLTGLIDHIPVAAGALTADAKMKKRRDIEAKREALKYEEDVLVRALLDNAQLVTRCIEAEPRHVLGCRIVSHDGGYDDVPVAPRIPTAVKGEAELPALVAGA